MDKGAPTRILNQATSQIDRWRAAPSPHDVKVDGRSLAQLLAFGAQYGALINFYDLTDREDGDWSIFFVDDPSIALALLASLDIVSLGAELNREIQELKTIHGIERRLKALRRIVGAILRLVRILDNGQGLGEAGGGLAKAIRWEIKSALAAPLQNFAIHTTLIAPEPNLRADLDGLSALWGISRAAPGSDDNLVTPSNDWIDTIIAALEELVAVLLAALARLSAQAAGELEASLATGGHAPQSALYDAFVVLFRYAQDTVNRFPRKLVEYYYYTILKQDSRAAVPDQVYLTFTPTDGLSEAAVPKGTQFPAGVDADGDAINYAAERSLAVYPSAVSALRTLRVTQQVLATAGTDPAAPSVPAQALSGIVTLADKAPVIAQPFPLFGETAVGTDGVLTTSLASLGFAVASPTLLMTSGTRTVTLTFNIGAASWKALLPTLEAIGAQAGGMTAQAVLTALFQAGFALRYSTAGGWIAIPGYGVTMPGAATAVALSFTLNDGAPPFVALATDPADPNATPAADGSQIPTTDTPVLMASLNQAPVTLGSVGKTVTVYPYAVLSGMAIETLSVEADVTGLTQLTLTTPSGPADTGQPFSVLGSPPVQFATLAVSSSELFGKPLQTVKLGVAWYGMVTSATGFAGYYAGYVVDIDGNPPPDDTVLFDNLSFRNTVSVSNPGWWQVNPPVDANTDDPWPLYLFRTDAKPVPIKDGKVLDATRFDDLHVAGNTPPAHYDPSQSALNLTLTAPSYAFGDTLYARNVMAASLNETALASACAQHCAKTGESISREIGALAAVIDAVLAANANAPDGTYRQAIADAVGKALPQMTGTALKLMGDRLGTLARTDTSGETDKLRASLAQAIAGGRTAEPLPQDDLFAEDTAPGLTQADVVRNLSAWLKVNGAALGPAILRRARNVLSAEELIIEAAADAAKPPLSAARAKMAAALLAAKSQLTEGDGETIKECIDGCMGDTPSKTYPNAPWLPMAVSVTVDYHAQSLFPRDAALGQTFYWLAPFETVAAVPWIGAVPLLQPQLAQGALFVGLTGTPEYLTLLFQMSAGPAGWSSDPPEVDWYQQNALAWTPLTPPETLQGDGTNGLQNTGIVSLKLAAPPPNALPADAPLLWLMLAVPKEADEFPLLGGVTTNALTAAWVGPGGAQTLGTPLPAGTITASDPVLGDIATIDQPLPSFGGRPLVKQDRKFWMWMAERLRHKDRGIQDWDYARLALADFPTLWQAGVLPARDADGKHAPGCVQVVAVAGPDTPNVSDPTGPLADPTLLGEIGELLETRISAFVTLDVANPLYVRITVKADLMFSPADTVAAWTKKLNGELVAWLSPWPPPPELGPRPSDYYNDFAIAEFVRGRPYVEAILSMSLSYAPQGETTWCYLTSAITHDLSGELATS